MVDVVPSERSEEFFNTMLIKLFDMNHIDIVGFRRMRTISQLIYESIPQIVLQTRILSYVRAHPEEKSIDISVQTIEASILTGVLHFMIEILFIWKES